MTERQHLPADLGSTTPGPELAALLDRIELATVADEQVVGVLQASWRQLAHAHARYVAALVEVGRREPAATTPNRRTRPDDGWRVLESAEWCCNEISAALTFTAHRADTEYRYAVALLGRLPHVWAALLSGRIDPPKARLFVDYLADLTEEQIAVICARLLPQAPRLTTGQLAHRLLRAVLAIDPGYARRRYRRGLRERGVWGYLAADGTAVLAGHGLPPGDAAAAAERLEQLAAAVRAGGHPHSEQQLRVDLLLRLLDGRFTGLTREQIIDAMLADRGPDGAGPDEVAANVDSGDPSAPWEAERSGPAAGGATTGAAKTGAAKQPGVRRGGSLVPRTTQPGRGEAGEPSATASAVDSSAVDRSAVDRSAVDQSAVDQPAVDQSAVDKSAVDSSAVDPTAGRPATNPPTSTASTPASADVSERPVGPTGDHTPTNTGKGAPASPRPHWCGNRPGIEVRVGLATLLGLDDHPAELPGWGPITAEHADEIIARHRAAEWRFAVVNDRGYLILGGLIRARPGPRPAIPSSRERDDGHGGVVEIHVRVGLLRELARCSDLPPGWAPVVADIAKQYAYRRRTLAGLDSCPRARFPGAGLRRHIQLRDRTCVAPGCRRPARKADQDHTREHAHGGATIRANLAPLCERHHRMKHDGGWQLSQPEPGLFRWASPLGCVYRTRGEPIAPDLPGAVPDAKREAEPTEEEPDREVGPIFDPRARRHPRPPPPPPASDLPDEPPF